MLVTLDNLQHTVSTNLKQASYQTPSPPKYNSLPDYSSSAKQSMRQSTVSMYDNQSVQQMSEISVLTQEIHNDI